MKRFTKKLLIGITAAALMTGVILPASLSAYFTKAETVSAESEDTSGSEGTKEYEAVTLYFDVEKTIDDGETKFNRDKSVNQFVFRMYDTDGTDENGGYDEKILPRDSADRDDPDKSYIGPGKMTFTKTYTEAGTHKYTIREISPDEGFTDEEGKPLPYKTEGMKYDDSVEEINVEIIEKDGELVPVIEGIELMNGSRWGAGFFNNISSNPKVTGVTVKANGIGESVTLAEGESAVITANAEFENISVGDTYTIVSILFEDFVPLETIETPAQEGMTSLSTTFTKKVSEESVYDVVTLIMKGDERVRAYNGNFDEESSEVNIMQQDSGSDEPTQSPSENTTTSDETTTSSDGITTPETSESESYIKVESRESGTQTELAAGSKGDTSKAAAINTGDTSGIMLLVITAVASGAAIAVTIGVVKYKSRKG